MNLLVTFCILNVINVILQTIKSIVTINCGKWAAASMNAIAFGLYQVILVYSVCDLPLFTKVVVVAIANFIGVYVTKYFQEKLRKDKLWKVEATVDKDKGPEVIALSEIRGLPYNYVDIKKYYLFNFYCATQEESAQVKKLLNSVNAKYFVTESKIL